MVDEPTDELVTVTGDGESSFVSDLPGGDASSPAAGGASGESAVAVDASEPGGGGAERAIAEADILQLDGDRLYALSQFSGLSVVDVSDPENLRLQGVYRSAATPFEMYVEDGIVYAMFNGWSSYVCDDAQGCRWEQTSRMQAIDARDPAAITLLADREVPGSISDSRRVGDVLYLVTTENGWCWRCETNSPNVTVSSFNVATATELLPVDQLRFASPEDSYIGQRSISVTTERVYISGWQWTRDRDSQTGSIQVVDISDPDGDLEAGAEVPIAGQIQNRWQMDEYDGVLRVISQPDGWGTSTPPVVETFRVASASDIQQAASLTMVLPRAEALQSVRFDGNRAYAITFERIDPLFTFDLSDPDAPRQVGELEMPGWVYHMEPRGDRLLALGFDNGSEVGSLNVSLFDVSELETPTLLDRAEFGGDWGSFAEDQDRVHKAFSILEDEGLILVPYSGGQYDEVDCSYEYGSGIQLVDYAGDALTVRGSAPQVGTARRALLHRDHLFGIGDNAVQTFDISDRDAPVAVDTLDVARNVSTVRVVDDHLMRFGNDWWTGQTTLEMTPLSRAAEAAPEAEIDLSELFGENAWTCGGGTNWGGEVFTQGDYAYVPRYTYHYDERADGSYTYEQRLTFYVIDLSDRSAPRAVGSFDVDPVRNDDNAYFAGITRTENTLLVGRATGYYYYGSDGNRQRPRFEYDIIDLSNPAAPVVASQFEVPRPVAGYGWGYAVAGCTMDMGWGWYGGYGAGSTISDGDLIVSNHSEPLDDGSDRVRYFMDRLDLSDPANPVLLPSVNVPGSVVHFEAESGQIVTIDHHNESAPGDDGEGCRQLGQSWWFDGQQCRHVRRSLNALVLEGDRAVRKSQLLLDGDRTVQNFAVSDSRVFYTAVEDRPATGSNAEISSGNASLETLRIVDGSFQRLPTTPLGERPYWWWGQLMARGDRAFSIDSNRVLVVDTSVPTEPVRLTHDIPGWGCSSLEVGESAAYCALGQRGVEVIDLSSMR